MDIDKPSLDELFEDLKHPNPSINLNAFKAMYSFWPDDSKDRLILNLKSADVDIRRKSIKALSYFGEEIIETVAELYLMSKSRIMKVSCLKILILIIANNKISNALLKLDQVIKDSLNDKSVEITLGLINLLRQIGEPAIPILIRLAKDNDLLRCKAAITALQEIPDEKANIFLKQFAKELYIDPIIRDTLDQI